MNNDLDTEYLKTLLTNYISAWGWHLIAIMFFIKLLGFILVREYLWVIGLLGVVCLCEVMAFLRKKDVIEAENDLSPDAETIEV